jgi:hypothetical protein
VKRRFTRTNVAAVFDQWPQAVSADDGDLRVLHDMANSGAQIWGEGLPWPDYLWLDFEGDLPNRDKSEIRNEVYDIEDPSGGAKAARFSVVAETLDKSHLPPSGTFRVTNRPIAMIELKVIDADLVAKLKGYRSQTPWPQFIRMKLQQWFDKRLQEANEQVAGGKRLIGFSEARGISVVVNEGSPALKPELVMGYLATAIKKYPHLDGILYLSDSLDPRRSFAFIVKDEHDQTLNRISTQLFMMLVNFTYESDIPISRSGPQPKLLARIEMDERSRKMYRTWATGWRRTDDPTPIPQATMTMSFARQEDFVPGLPKTPPDRNLLDLRLRWDRDGTNLRIEN